MANEIEDPESRDILFHYDRSDRERTLSDSVRTRGKKGPFWKRNRSQFIILIDILVISLIYMIVAPYISTRSVSKEFQGYMVRLKAFEYDEKVLLSLQVRNNAPADQDLPTESNQIRYRFYTEEGEWSSEGVDILPVLGGDVRTFHGSAPKEGIGGNRIMADVEILGEIRTLNAEIERD